MNEEANKIWQSEAGGNLFRNIINKKPLTMQDLMTLNELKAIQGFARPPTDNAESSKNPRMVIRDICDRLQQLLEEQSDPESIMEYLLEPLNMSGLAPNGLPTDTPMAFVCNLEEVLNQAEPGTFQLVLPIALSDYESAEALLLDLLPIYRD